MSEIVVEGRYRRLPADGKKCAVSQFSRAYIYKLEKAGEIRLLRVSLPGKARGITLLPVAEIEAFLHRRGKLKGGE